VPIKVAIDGATLGLAATTLYVEAPPVDDAGSTPPTMMAGIATREITGMQRMADVQAFVEALIVRGRVRIEPKAGGRRALAASLSQARKHATHYLDKRADAALELKRIAFECC
jgi:hypothetical protein